MGGAGGIFDEKKISPVLGCELMSYDSTHTTHMYTAQLNNYQGVKYTIKEQWVATPLYKSNNYTVIHGNVVTRTGVHGKDCVNRLLIVDLIAVAVTSTGHIGALEEGHVKQHSNNIQLPKVIVFYIYKAIISTGHNCIHCSYSSK